MNCFGPQPLPGDYFQPFCGPPSINSSSLPINFPIHCTAEMPSKRRDPAGNLPCSLECQQQRLARENEQQMKRVQRLLAMKLYMRTRRENESDNERVDRLTNMRRYAQHRRQNETESERSHRLSNMRQYAKMKRENETDEERVRRLSRIKQYVKHQRENRVAGRKTRTRRPRVYHPPHQQANSNANTNNNNISSTREQQPPPPPPPPVPIPPPPPPSAPTPTQPQPPGTGTALPLPVPVSLSVPVSIPVVEPPRNQMNSRFQWSMVKPSAFNADAFPQHYCTGRWLMGRRMDKNKNEVPPPGPPIWGFK